MINLKKPQTLEKFSQFILASLTTSLYWSDLQCHQSGSDLLYCETSLLHQHAWPIAMINVMQLGSLDTWGQQIKDTLTFLCLWMLTPVCQPTSKRQSQTYTVSLWKTSALSCCINRRRTGNMEETINGLLLRNVKNLKNKDSSRSTVSLIEVLNQPGSHPCKFWQHVWVANECNYIFDKRLL